MHRKARNVVGRGPESPRMTSYLAPRISDLPSMQLKYDDPLMVVSIHLTSLEGYVYVRTLTDNYSGMISGLFERNSARAWTEKLISAGFNRVRNEK